MLAITGNLNGKPVEDQIISASDVIKLFNLPISKDAEKIVFELDKKSKGVIAINPVDGSERFAYRSMLKPIATGTYKNESYTVQYYNTRRQNNKGGYTYSPNRVDFMGKRHSINTDQDLEKAVFFLLHPWCKDSPLRNRNSISRYKLFSAEKESMLKIQEEERHAKLRDMVLQMDDARGIRIAKAISHKHGGTIPQSGTETAATAKASLLVLMRENRSLCVTPCSPKKWRLSVRSCKPSRKG